MTQALPTTARASVTIAAPPATHVDVRSADSSGSLDAARWSRPAGGGARDRHLGIGLARHARIAQPAAALASEPHLVRRRSPRLGRTGWCSGPAQRACWRRRPTGSAAVELDFLAGRLPDDRTPARWSGRGGRLARRGPAAAALAS